MEEEKTSFTAYQLNLMKKTIIKKILDIEDGSELFNLLLVIDGVRESLTKNIKELENKIINTGLKINQSIL